MILLVFRCLWKYTSIKNKFDELLLAEYISGHFLEFQALQRQWTWNIVTNPILFWYE